ncbi:hypothetical protein EZS27_028458, partial [termite gut metagenome]
MKKFLIFSLILTLGLFFFSCTEKNTVEIKDKISSLSVGETHQLICVVLPLTLQAEGVSWESSNSTVASISDTGLITALEQGSVSFTCRSNGNNKVYDTMTIQVINPTYVVSALEIKGSTTITLGQDVQYTIKVTPEQANKEVTWSVNNSIFASVSSTGLLHPQGTGSIVLKAISQENSLIFAELSITIVRSFDAVLSITVLGDTSLSLTQTKTYQAAVSPSIANPVVTWSVDQPTLGTISSTGVLTPLQGGTIKVIATSIEDSSKFGELDVTILTDEIPLESFLIEGENQIVIGSDYSYQINPLPSDATHVDVLWEVDNLEIATVNEEGILHPLAPGNIILTAISSTDSSLFDQFNLTIYAPVASLQINGNPIVHLGTPQAYQASILPITSQSDVIWSVSDEQIATIDQNGLLTPIQPGIINVLAISANYPLIQDSISIQIYELVQNVVLNSHPEIIFIGSSLVLTASVSPSTAIQSLLWTVDHEETATINPTTGLLHPLTDGVITIRATSSDDVTKYATCAITIYEVISSFTINGSDIVRIGTDESYTVS